jgi:hypothetical protein
MLVWGIVPTNTEPFGKETSASLEHRLTTMWSLLEKKGIDLAMLTARSMLSPATCCLVNPDIEKTVEKAFTTVKDLSLRLREKHRIIQ